MRNPVTALALVIAAVLVVGAGVALAGPSTAAGWTDAGPMQGQMHGQMQGQMHDQMQRQMHGQMQGQMHSDMHGSQEMRALHAQMPADAQARCDAMHAEMAESPSMMGDMPTERGMDGMHRQRRSADR